MATFILLTIAFLIGLGIYYVTNLTFEIREKTKQDRMIKDVEYRVLEDEKHEELETRKKEHQKQ